MSTITTTSVQREPQQKALRLALFLGAAAGLAMVGLGAYAALMPLAAAKAYGLPDVATEASVWVRVVGVRDLALGALSLAFAALGERRALGLLAACGAIVPLGDGYLVWHFGGEVVPFVAIHWSSAVGCVLYAAYLLKRPRM